MRRNQNILASTSFVVLILLALFSAPLRADTPPSLNLPQPINLQNWEEVFRDDFNETQLNTTKWRVGDNLVRTTAQYQLYYKDDVYLEDGNLVLQARYNPTTFNGKVYNYTGGYIDTNSSTSLRFKYGYAEARIKLPNIGKLDSSLPAFWGLPADYSRWPFTGELDIMELSSAWKKDYEAYVYSTLIYGRRFPDGTNCTVYSQSSLKVDLEQYHTYGLLWTENQLTFYIDNIPFKSVVNNEPSTKDNCPIYIPNRNYYLIFTMAVQEKIAKPEHYPKKMYVDYIRVLQPKSKSK